MDLRFEEGLVGKVSLLLWRSALRNSWKEGAKYPEISALRKNCCQAYQVRPRARKRQQQRARDQAM